MCNAVITAKWQGVVFENGVKHWKKVHNFFSAGLVCQ